MSSLRRLPPVRPTQMEETVELSDQPTSQALAFRHPVDGVLLCSLLGLLPLLLVFCADFWLRTDLRFFPMLILVPILMVSRSGRLNGHQDRARSLFTIGCLITAGLLAIFAAANFSPWLAVLAILLACIGWMLERFASRNWFELVGWTIPAWVLLVLPLSDTSNLAYPLAASVSASSSSLLDLIGIPQMATHSTLEIRSGRISVSDICQGLGNPYLLLALVVLMSIILRRSILIGLLSALSVPAWAWMGAVLHLVIGVVLFEYYEIYVFAATRAWIAQLVTLLTMLLAIGLVQVALNVLLAPFEAYAAIGAEAHSLFNHIVSWPTVAPLRKRRHIESEETPVETGNALQHRHARIILAVCGVAFLGSGAYSVWTLSRNPVMKPMWVAREAIEAALSSETLASDLHGMRLLGFDQFGLPLAPLPQTHVAQWTYVLGGSTQRVELSAVIPLRGFYPAEIDYLSPQGRVLESRKLYNPQNDSTGLWVNEVVLADPLFGSSYLCYCNFGLDGQELVPPQGSFMIRVADRITYQPTVASLRLYVVGIGATTDEQREGFRQALIDATDQLLAQLAILSAKSD